MDKENGPELVVEYLDPEEGFRGWLVIDSLAHGIAAGGMRVCQGLTREHLCAMAGNMTRKMRIAGLGLDGAKCGIAYDPAAPGKAAAMSRFLAAIAPLVRERYSMGPDLNVSMDELSAAAAAVGISHVKMAVARVMGWDEAYFAARCRVLHEDVGQGRSLGEVRAGYGVAGAAAACLEHLGLPMAGARLAIQGAGTLARGLLHALQGKGARVVAIADAEKTFYDENGIDLERFAPGPSGLLPESCGPARRLGRDAVIECGCDLLLPLAVEGVISAANAGKVRARAVVPGANLAVSPDGYEALHRRGVLAVPDFLAGAGGSISMQGLFAPKQHPRAADVLRHTFARTRELTLEIIATAQARGTSPFAAAIAVCAGRKVGKSGY